MSEKIIGRNETIKSYWRAYKTYKNVNLGKATKKEAKKELEEFESDLNDFYFDNPNYDVIQSHLEQIEYYDDLVKKKADDIIFSFFKMIYQLL